MDRKPDPVMWMALAFGIALALAAAVFITLGTSPHSIRLALRLTARWSILLFWIAYTGGAIARITRPRLAWLAGQGRTFGLVFAAAHLVHLGLLPPLYWATRKPPLEGSTLVLFVVGATWIYLLAAMSFTNGAKVLGPRGWHLLRLLGMNYILMAFGYDFVAFPLRDSLSHLPPAQLLGSLPFAVLTVAAPALCVADALRSRRTVQSAMP